MTYRSRALESERIVDERVNGLADALEGRFSKD